MGGHGQGRAATLRQSRLTGVVRPPTPPPLVQGREHSHFPCRILSQRVQGREYLPSPVAFFRDGGRVGDGGYGLANQFWKLMTNAMSPVTLILPAIKALTAFNWPSATAR